MFGIFGISKSGRAGLYNMLIFSQYPWDSVCTKIERKNKIEIVILMKLK
jgi:hypothetical protein